MEEQLKAVQIFNFQGNQEIRATVIDGDPWFSAADVCRALGIVNSRDAVSRLPEKWKSGVGNTDGLQMSLQATLIKEPAVYKLAFQSRKSEAEAFTEWVAEEVLPAIRKTGSYIAPGAHLPGIDQLVDLEAINQAIAGLNEYIVKLREYRRLSPPVSAQQMKAVDQLPSFIEECCVSETNATIQALSFYHAYKKWCEENTVSPVSNALFGKFVSCQYHRTRKTRGVFYYGVQLVESNKFIK